MTKPDPRILDAFRERLLGAIGRSPLTKVSITKTGRLLDLARMQFPDANLGEQILKTVIGNEEPIAIDFTRRLDKSAELAEAAASKDSLSESDLGRCVQDRVTEMDLLEKRFKSIMRGGATAKRETGVHTVWLGYPLMYVAVLESEPIQYLFAPLFLWPVAIAPDRHHQGRYLVRRDTETGPPQFNRAMATWIKSRLLFDVSAPSQDELKELAWETIPGHVKNLVVGFPSPPVFDRNLGLQPTPKPSALLPQQGPQLFNSAVLGYFTWQNEAILADVQSIKDKSECQGPVAGFISGVPLDKPAGEPPVPSEQDRYVVCEADFSQESVLWKARMNPGLVVHGPPGTGKSQTIVNIIADALAHGRTVLMVCQKQAATHVVLERMRKVELSDLCMEVHDPESERTRIFKEIREQVQLLPSSQSALTTRARRLQLADRIVRLKEELDRVAGAFHDRHGQIGLSYRAIKAREGRVSTAFRTARPLPGLYEVLGKLSAMEVDQVCPDLQRMGQLFKDADPLNNPWQHHQPTIHATLATEEDVNITLSELRQLDARHAEYSVESGDVRCLPDDIGAFSGASDQIMERLRTLQEHPKESLSKLTLWWLKVLRLDATSLLPTYIRKCADAVELSAQVAEVPLDPVWSRACSGLSTGEIQAHRLQAECVSKYGRRWWRFASPSFRSSRKAINALCGDGAEKSPWEKSRRLLAHLKAQGLRDHLASMNRSLVPGLNPRLPDDRTQSAFPQLARESLDAAAWLYAQERKFELLGPVFDALHSPSQPERIADEMQSLSHNIQRLTLVREMLNHLAGLETYLQPESFRQPRLDILAGKSIKVWLDRLDSGFKRLRSLLCWESDRKQRDEPRRTILLALEEYEVRRQRGENLPAPGSDFPSARYGEWWRALVEFTAIMQWLGVCHEARPELLSFEPGAHAQKRKELQGVIKEKRKLEAEAIREHWLTEQVAIRNEPWKKLFQLSGVDSKRLRQAIESSLPRGLLKLRPCWLVDPGTAAQIFPLKANLFDLVIFDEASQCPVEYAVPAIYRGKSLIVSGDSMQLPPTSFFSTRVQTSQDEQDVEEEDDATDETVTMEDRQLRQINTGFLTTVEDLLAASSGNLPEDRLLVHYRSDHPRLIEFSNRAFYHGQLEAPPARMSPLNEEPPIRYHQVNGLYANRTNRDEAHKVVELLKLIWGIEGESPTIGVVTFNGPQRDLIEDALEKECQRDEAFARRYQEELSRKEDNQDVGFFVKNLENVQGDERDTMIFSTTFGRNENGDFHRRFGPVGQVRGERRLNVAVTRAKHQIIVVSSMPIEEISSALSTAQGPGTNLTPKCYLQLYLAYARAVSEGDQNQIERILERLSHATRAAPSRGVPDDSPLEEEVRQELVNRGYKVDCQVGESGFRIDLAVVHPDSKRGYLLGIECDGATYHSGRAAHLRDVWREAILQRRGWKLHRIWSTHWWYRRADEIEKLLEAISAALSLADATRDSASTGNAVFRSLPNEKATIARPKQVPAPDFMPLNGASQEPLFRGMINPIEVESGARNDEKSREIEDLVAVLDLLRHPGVAGTPARGSRRTKLDCWRSALSTSSRGSPEAIYDALAKCDTGIRMHKDKVLASIRTWHAKKSLRLVKDRN